MKKQFVFTLILIIVFSSIACKREQSTDDSNENNPPEFAMTAKINGNVFQANNPFGTNEFSSTNIFTYYPIEDFVLLIGRQGGTFGNPEIDIWLKRSDIVVGSYSIGATNFQTPPSHFIDLVDNSNNIDEYTKEGTITITDVDTSAKIVQGTFEFTTTQDPDGSSSVQVDFHVTEGKFYYKYE